MKKEEIINKYEQLLVQNRDTRPALNRMSAIYGWSRLIIAVFLVVILFNALTEANLYYYAISAGLLAVFVFLVKKHRQVIWDRDLKDRLIEINQNELDFIKNHVYPGENGEQWINPAHNYTYDLDVFGENSLFHHLNRTVIYAGTERLAGLLSHEKPTEDILANQEVVGELAQKPEWRQQFAALGKIIEDKEGDYQKLTDWAQRPAPAISQTVKIISWILPALFISFLMASLFTHFSLLWLIGAFVLNMAFFKSQAKMIKDEVVESENIAEIIQNYSLMLELIEQESFQSEKLKLLQKQLTSGTGSSSKALKKLSEIFLKISGVNFDLAVLTLTGSVLYHFHVLQGLLKWKKQHAGLLKSWLDVMAETDAINSLANFAYNNPGYVFPDLNTGFEADFKDLGHPLLPDETRICNDIKLDTSNFIILTGSNMSGKSTFLRTLGVNMLLGSIGAPVCAKHADIHPLPILVSMRQTDSLSSGESYFFAEVKRLKKIIDQIEATTSFVLLDEILRGTNSDDKQSGTIGVIKKIIDHQVVGGIATHDLEICQMADQFPDKLQNKNFEVEIINDELVFDYKLREGVCKNKSATFLMEKMEII